MYELLAHGSPVKFDEFDLSYCRRMSMGRGFYFTSDFEMAKVYSGSLDPIVARIRIENPYEIDGLVASNADVMSWARMFKMPDARERLLEAGYDGVAYREGDFVEAVAFHSEQLEVLGRYPSFEVAELMPAGAGI